jgi:hypothetical protein
MLDINFPHKKSSFAAPLGQVWQGSTLKKLYHFAFDVA